MSGTGAIRLRHMIRIGPRPSQDQRLAPDVEVTFAPMDALADGLGGLDASQTRPYGEVAAASYNFFADGDLLLAKVTPCFENGKKALATGLMNGIGFATSEVHVLRLDRRQIEPRYLLYLLSSEDFRAAGMASMTGAGGLRRVSEAAVLNYRPKVVRLEQQKAIADFLDRETARIHRLIEKKERLVTLINERYSSEVTAEVIGLTQASVGTKLSRSPFIRKIPADWEDAQLKHLVRPGTSITYGIVQAGPEHEGGVPYIRTGDMKGSELPISGYPHTSPEIERSYSRSRMEKGDLVIAIRATVGKCLRLPDELVGANLTQGTAKISPGPKVQRDFLLYAIQSAPSQSYFEESSKGATFKEITLDRLRRLVVPLPPQGDQARIVERLRAAEARCMKLREVANISADRLREFRAALITAAVTGQIDVADWQKRGHTDRRLDRIEEEMAS